MKKICFLWLERNTYWPSFIKRTYDRKVGVQSFSCKALDVSRSYDQISRQVLTRSRQRGLAVQHSKSGCVGELLLDTSAVTVQTDRHRQADRQRFANL